MNGTGHPGSALLEVFGELVWDAFEAMPYLVGTAAMGKKWRDVDVRVILPDRRYRLLFGHDPHNSPFAHSRRGVIQLAFCALGHQITGLPIDFQIQSSSMAHEHFGDRIRIPIGIAHVVESGRE